MVAIGIACLVATSILALTVPHFCLGLGIGVVDSALVPLLATIVDKHYDTNDYAVVYSLQQSAVSLAYALGPLVGGWLAKQVGFPTLMAFIGFLNVMYSPILICLAPYAFVREEYTRI